MATHKSHEHYHYQLISLLAEFMLFREASSRLDLEILRALQEARATTIPKSLGLPPAKPLSQKPPAPSKYPFQQSQPIQEPEKTEKPFSRKP